MVVDLEADHFHTSHSHTPPANTTDSAMTISATTARDSFGGRGGMTHSTLPSRDDQEEEIVTRTTGGRPRRPARPSSG